MLPNLARESVGMSMIHTAGGGALDLGERRDTFVIERRISYNRRAMPRCFVGIK